MGHNSGMGCRDFSIKHAWPRSESFHVRPNRNDWNYDFSFHDCDDLWRIKYYLVLLADSLQSRTVL